MPLLWVELSQAPVYTSSDLMVVIRDKSPEVWAVRAMKPNELMLLPISNEFKDSRFQCLFFAQCIMCREGAAGVGVGEFDAHVFIAIVAHVIELATLSTTDSIVAESYCRSHIGHRGDLCSSATATSSTPTRSGLPSTAASGQSRPPTAASACTGQCPAHRLHIDFAYSIPFVCTPC